MTRGDVGFRETAGKLGGWLTGNLGEPMPRKSILEDPVVRDLIVSVMKRDGNLDGAAAELEARGYPGLTRQAINKWARNGSQDAADLRARLNDAGARPTIADRSVTALAPAARAAMPGAVGPAVGQASRVVLDMDNLPGLSPHDLVLEVERIALDPDHRASGKALEIICKMKFGRIVRAQARLEAQLDAVAAAESVVSQDEGAAIIELPVNETEAPGRAPRPVDQGVLEAEVVDRG